MLSNPNPAFANLSIKVEYLYTDLGAAKVWGTSYNDLFGPFAGRLSAPARFHAVRLGLNWRFNPSAPAPVVASD